MSHLEDGRTEVSFKLCGYEPITRHIERRNRRDRPKTGLDALTPRQQAFLYHYGQGLDRAAIARKTGISWGAVNAQLWQARKRVGVDTLEKAWEAAREHIEANLHWLPLNGRSRKAHPEQTDAPILTEAQRVLLSLLAEGKAVKTAAEALSISANTAYVQLKNCRERLGCASTDEAVRKAKELGYISAVRSPATDRAAG